MIFLIPLGAKTQEKRNSAETLESAEQEVHARKLLDEQCFGKKMDYRIMNITTMQMYWLVMLDSIKECCIAVIVICGFFIALGIPVLGTIDKEELFFPLAKKVIVVASISLLFATFLPNTKQMAAIMIVPKIANSEKVQTIGNKVYDLAAEWMNELKPTKKEGAK